jgi:hypothetical protein
MPTLLTSEALSRLADDVVASAWLLPEGDPVRAYLSMLGALPADEEAWLDVLEPWLCETRRGWRPPFTDPSQIAAVAAAGVSALRASRDLRTTRRWTRAAASRPLDLLLRPSGSLLTADSCMCNQMRYSPSVSGTGSA